MSDLKDEKEKIEKIYCQTKEKTNEIYNLGKNFINDAEQILKENSDVVINTIKENPLTSLLIAGGIGFIACSLLKK